MDLNLEEVKKYELDIFGHKLSMEFGRLAKQANAAVLVQYGDTVVLSAVTASENPSSLDFFPLTVNLICMCQLLLKSSG